MTTILNKLELRSMPTNTWNFIKDTLQDKTTLVALATVPLISALFVFCPSCVLPLLVCSMGINLFVYKNNKKLFRLTVITAISVFAMQLSQL